MAKNTLIELTNLELVISREGASAQYPVLSADIAYAVGSFPVVSVTVSTAGTFSGNGSDRSSAADILRDDPEGALGELIMSYSGAGQSADNCTLFCGYIATVTPTLQSSIFSVSSTLSVQLVCATAAINGTPPGALMYFNLGGASNGCQRPNSYGQLINILRPENDAKNLSLSNAFQKAPAQCVAQLLDRLRGVVAEHTMGMKIEDTLIFGEGGLKVELPPNNNIAKTFLEQMSKMLAGAPTAAVYNAVLKQLYLVMIPETMGTAETPCKMITRPINAWDVKSAFALKVNDYLSVQEHTAYRLDQRVDFWCVQFPPSTSNPAPGRFAVYGPGVCDGAGKAVTYTEDEFNSKIAEVGKNKLLSTYSAKIIMLPEWLRVIETTQATINARLKKNLPPTATVRKNPEKEETTLIDVAERLAITGYLQEGCAVVATGMQIPFYTYLKLLPHLGKMGTFTVPDAHTAQKKNTDDIPTSIRYGLLSALSMRITVESKDLHVSCSAQFTHVHTEEMHKQFAAPHPLYDGVSASAEVAETAINDAVNKISQTAGDGASELGEDIPPPADYNGDDWNSAEGAGIVAK